VFVALSARGRGHGCACARLFGAGSSTTDIPVVSDYSPALRVAARPRMCARQAMFDPLAIAVDDRTALEQWDAALTELGVVHSPILDAVTGWLIVIQDPDGPFSRECSLSCF
jgi:hypothetical protein